MRERIALISKMAAMLHDLHAYQTGSYDDHAHKGAELARKYFHAKCFRATRRLPIFSRRLSLPAHCVGHFWWGISAV